MNHYISQIDHPYFLVWNHKNKCNVSKSDWRWSIFDLIGIILNFWPSLDSLKISIVYKKLKIKLHSLETYVSALFLPWSRWNNRCRDFDLGVGQIGTAKTSQKSLRFWGLVTKIMILFEVNTWKGTWIVTLLNVFNKHLDRPLPSDEMHSLNDLNKFRMTLKYQIG